MKWYISLLATKEAALCIRTISPDSSLCTNTLTHVKAFVLAHFTYNRNIVITTLIRTFRFLGLITPDGRHLKTLLLSTKVDQNL